MLETDEFVEVKGHPHQHADEWVVVSVSDSHILHNLQDSPAHSAAIYHIDWKRTKSHFVEEWFSTRRISADLRIWSVSRTQVEPGIERDFREIASRWRKETRILSSIQAKIFHRDYQRIIGMGPAVLPFIFAEMEAAGGQWYWALECITGDNPALGAPNVPLVKKAWLDYAVRNGFLRDDQRRY